MKLDLWTFLNATSMKCAVFWVVITSIVPLRKENNPFSIEANWKWRKNMVKIKWSDFFFSLHKILILGLFLFCIVFGNHQKSKVNVLLDTQIATCKYNSDQQSLLFSNLMSSLNCVEYWCSVPSSTYRGLMPFQSVPLFLPWAFLILSRVVTRASRCN